MSSSLWAQPSPPVDPTLIDTHRALAAQCYSGAATHSSKSVSRGARAKQQEAMSAKHATLAAQHAQNAALNIVRCDQLLRASGQPPSLDRAREHLLRAAGHHQSAVQNSTLADEYANMAALERMAANQHAILALQRGDAARSHLDTAAAAMRRAALACLVHPRDAAREREEGEGVKGGK